MQRKIVPILLTLTIVLSGCTAPVNEVESDDVPIRLSFSAETLDRTEDEGGQFDLKEALQSGPVLALWIAAGCSGCHDWTQLIRESFDNGSLNDSIVNVISIHRWGDIESSDRVMEVFGVEDNNSYYTPWPIILPKESTMLLDFTTGSPTKFSVYDGFNNPGTPTVQLIGQNGIKMWQSKSYWANYTMLEEAMSVAELIIA